MESKDILEIRSTKDFADYIDDKIDGLDFQVKKDKNLEIETSQIAMLCSLFIEKKNEWTLDFMKCLLNDVLKKPISTNGKVYEALVYSWLTSHNVQFKPQVQIASGKCLKKNGYEADGIMNGICFDVKEFGITLPHIDTLRKKIQKIVPADYFVTIGGTKNISTRDLKKQFLDRLPQLVQEIMSDRNRVHTDYIYENSKYGIEIRLHSREKDTIII